MDKHIQAKLVWGLFVIFYLLGSWSLGKSWADGEFTRSSRSGFKSWKIRREDNPSGFQRYLIGMLVINGFFLVALIVWGWALFFWR
jgi:hypothetical protein